MLAMDVRRGHLLVAPPHRRDGVAAMLVALGDAGIVVTQVEPDDDSGMYRLTVSGSVGRSAEVLEGIGCRIGTSPTGVADDSHPIHSITKDPERSTPAPAFG